MSKQTLNSYFLEIAGRFAEKDALIYKKGHHFERLSFGELQNLVFKFANALEKRGVKKGDTVVLISKNRPEWIISDLAILLLGAVNVPVHQVLSGKQMKGIIDEVKSRVVIACSKDTVFKLQEAGVLSKMEIITFDDLNDDFPKYKKNLLFFKDIIDKEETVSRKDSSDEDEVASIIYTSGTTGNFAGVILTHKNFVSNIEGVKKAVPINKNDKLLSVLPLSHVFERTAGYYVPLFSGATISYIEDPTQLAEIAYVEKPTIILAVPRLYEKIYDKIITATAESPLKEKIFQLALKYGRKYNVDNEEGAKLFYKIFDKIAFSKVKNKFGGKIRFLVSGAAPLSKEIAEFFLSMGWLVLEGYGLTETSPVLSCNKLDDYKFGTVGKPLHNVTIKIGEDSEIMVKGPNITQGYFKNDKKTKGSFTKNGYFLTGDLGKIDEDGFLSISGRKKEIIVLSTGKKVFPIIIEEELESNPYILQAMVFGDGEKHVAALIVPDFEVLKTEFKNINEKNLGKNEKALELLNKQVGEATKHFASYEKISKFVLADESFTVENGLLTPTFKLRRHLVLEKYKDQIEKFYHYK